MQETFHCVRHNPSLADDNPILHDEERPLIFNSVAAYVFRLHAG